MESSVAAWVFLDDPTSTIGFESLENGFPLPGEPQNGRLR